MVGYALFRSSGRNVVADFVRPTLAVIAIGLASFLLIIARHKIIAMLVLFVTGLPVSCAILLTFTYYQSIGSVFTGDDVVAIDQSNIEEIWDFLDNYIFNFTSLFVTLVTLALYIALAYCQIKGFSLDRQTQEQLKKKMRLHPESPLDVSHKARRLFLKGLKTQATLGAALMVMTALVLYTQFRPIAYYRMMVRDLQTKIETFNDLVKKIESNPRGQAIKEQQGELYVLVIGESLSRDSMGLYNHSVDNTPFLSSLAQNGHTVVFPHAYSSFVNTVPSITASFSQGNLQTGLTFPHGNNLISLAKQAGIKTYWLSNQVKNGNADTPIGAISTLADYSFFTTNYVFDGSYSQQPDMILMPTIRQTLDKLDPKENKLLIIHLMGNHSPYYNRYPSDFPNVKISSPALIGRLSLEDDFESNLGNSNYENYLTSIKYNDLVLQEISKLVSARPDFQALVYYSDHGEALLYTSLSEKEQHEKSPMARHNVAQFSYAMTRIPLIINYSPSFAQRYPKATQALKANQNKVFTNDTLYDMMLDLMQIKSPDINYHLSMASLHYQRPDPSKITLVNNRFVGSDPDYIAYTNAHSRFGKSLAIKSANALFKANLALSKGYQNLHVNVIMQDGKLYVKALSDFSSKFLTLKDYMSKLSGTPHLLLELDNSSMPTELNEHMLQYAQAIGKNLLELTPEQQSAIYFCADNSKLLAILENYLVQHANTTKGSHTQPALHFEVDASASSNIPAPAQPQEQAQAQAELTQEPAKSLALVQAQAQDMAQAHPELTKEQVMAHFPELDQEKVLSQFPELEGNLPPIVSNLKHFDPDSAPYIDGSNMSIDQQNRLRIKGRNSGCNNKYHDGLPVKLVFRITDLKQLTMLNKLSPFVHYILLDESKLTTISLEALCNKHLIVSAPRLIVQDADFAYQMSWLKRRLPGTLVIVNYHNAFDSDF